MRLPRLPRPTAPAALRRPAVVVPATALSLAGLLGAGLVVANAVDAPPATPAAVEASPSPSPEPQASGGADGVTTVEATEDRSVTTSGGDDNVAVAVNTRDGSTVYAVRLKVVTTGADVVDSANAAVAAASCTDCQTVAIALEGVLVTGDAEVVAPENVALAINTGCSGCQTLAYAYQSLQTVDGKVRLTGAGRRGIALLRQELSGLRRSGLDVLAVRAEVDRIAAQFARLLQEEVVPIAPSAAPRATDAAAVQEPAPTTSPAVPEAPPSPSPSATAATPEPEQPSPAATPVPTASPTASTG